MRILSFANETFVVACAILLPFILTYLATLWRFRIVLRSKKKGKEPPTLPFMVPILSHVIPFAWDIRGTISTITYVVGPSRLLSTSDLKVHAELL